MFEKTDTCISGALKAFSACDSEVDLIVPTAMAMENGTMDSTASMQAHLQDTNYHD